MPYKRLTHYLDNNDDEVDIPNEPTLHTEFCRYLDDLYGRRRVQQINTDKTKFETIGGFDAALKVANEYLDQYRQIGDNQYNLLLQYKLSERRHTRGAEGYESWKRPFFSFQIHNQRDEEKRQLNRLLNELQTIDHVYYVTNSFCKMKYLEDLNTDELGYAFKFLKPDKGLEVHSYFTHRPDEDNGWACSTPEPAKAFRMKDLKLKSSKKDHFINNIETALHKTHNVQSGNLLDLIQHFAGKVGVIDVAERMYPLLRQQPQHKGARLIVISSILNEIYNMNMIFIEPKKSGFWHRLKIKREL